MALPSNLAQITAADNRLGPLVANLLMCLCEAAEARPNPPRHCTLRIGTEVPHDLGIDTDFCCEGVAYVSMGEMFPSSIFPDQDTARQATVNCAPTSWALTLRAGLFRCAPTGGDNGVTIPDKDWEAAALQNIYDTRTLECAALCFRNYVVGATGILMGMGMVINQIVQGNPLGGCVERYVTFTVQLPTCGC